MLRLRNDNCSLILPADKGQTGTHESDEHRQHRKLRGLEKSRKQRQNGKRKHLRYTSTKREDGDVSNQQLLLESIRSPLGSKCPRVSK